MSTLATPVTDSVPTTISASTATSRDTWDISGPTFLGLYTWLLALTLVAVLLVRKARDVRPTARSTADLDPYEIAFLNGGARFVASTALFSLHRRGVVTVKNEAVRHFATMPKKGDLSRVAAAGYLTIGTVPTSLPPIERALVDAVQARPGLRPQEAIGGLAGHPTVLALRPALEAKGMLRSGATRHRLYLAVLVFIPLLVFGFVRVLAGTSNHKPTGNLVAFLLVTVAIMAVAGISGERTPQARRILRANEANNQTMRARAAASLTQDVPQQDEAAAFAVYGPTWLWLSAPMLAMTLALPDVGLQSNRNFFSPSSSGADSSSGGGCSGGSGCGGGCGGGGCGG